ncbi:hypothetical protein [Streptomyces sp. NPDC005322]|uniref:hypothetical protein n=1 Tax=Streptomyces sp. NPDC005322 TaxID=3157032 RepID=UPI0033BE0B0F
MDRSLSALGFADVPALRPLTYPGRPVTVPTLLIGGELWDLEPAPGGRLGTWPAGGPSREPLDALLARLGEASTGERHPVIAVGSNASPAQLHHKLTRPDRPAVVPMIPVEVEGIAVGCSAHIGRYGYVASAPHTAPATRTPLVVSWLDADQLRAVDATEHPNYRRTLLPGADFPMTLPSGERLGGGYLYVGVCGVLLSPGATATPLPGGGDQSALLAGLLAASSRLRTLLGPDPHTWVTRASADPTIRKEGTQVFQDEGWALPQPAFLRYLEDETTWPAEPRGYELLSGLR